MCVSPGVRVATVTTRTTHSCAPYIGALLASVPASVSLFSLHETLPVFAFAFLHVCAFALLHLCAFALLFCSPLSAALVSALLSSLFCSSLLWSSRSLLCIRLCSAFASTPRFGSASVCFRLGLTRRVPVNTSTLLYIYKVLITRRLCITVTFYMYTGTFHVSAIHIYDLSRR